MTRTIVPPSKQSQWELVLNDGTNALKVIPFKGDSMLIGRAFSADIRLDDVVISRHHARLSRRDNQLVIEDLQTVNGTLVNHQRLSGPQVLQADDVIGLGTFTLKVTRAATAPPVPGSRPARSLGWGWLIAGGVLALLMMLAVSLGLYAWLSGRSGGVSPATTAGGAAVTVSQSPANNSRISLNQPVTVRATAADPAGIIRMELWVNGRKVDELDPQLTQVSQTMTAVLRWQPAEIGAHVLEVRVYNQTGQMQAQPVSTVLVVGELNTATAAPIVASPTVAQLAPLVTPAAPPPQATPAPTPLLLVPTPKPAILVITSPSISLRTGPGDLYNLLGQLVQGSQFQIVGQAYIGSSRWWLISYDVATGGLGWVLADPGQVSTINEEAVPAVQPPPTPTAAPVALKPTAPPATPIGSRFTPTPEPSSTPIAIPTIVSDRVIRAPAGQTLVIASNRSLENQPALLTLSGGKSVGGGQEIPTSPGLEEQIVLEPDTYRFLWSSTARGGFARGGEFRAEPGKIMVMWLVPEEGRAEIEVYDQLNGPGEVASSPPTITPTAAPGQGEGGYTAPPGKVLFVASNRSLNNSFAVLTLSGGSFGGGREVKLDAGVEIPLEMLPGDYRAMWSSPARREGFTAGRNFEASAGQVIFAWVVPEEGQIFIQFPGQELIEITN